MTFRERLQKEHPEAVSTTSLGGCVGCPKNYGYTHHDEPCYLDRTAGLVDEDAVCTVCWDRVIPEECTTTRKSVYIAGPITGVPDYFGAFVEAAEILEAAGYIPLTPTWQPQGLTNAQYMRMCLSMIDNADAVLFLSGWDKSKGARLERDYCQYIEKPYSDTLAGIEEVLEK